MKCFAMMVWRRVLVLLASACVVASAVAADSSWWQQTLRIEKTDNGISVRNARSGALIVDRVEHMFGYESFVEVWRGNKRGVIDKRGRLLLPVKYDEIDENDAARVFRVKRDGRWGLVGYDGSVRVPIRYDSIESDFRGRGAPWTVARGGHMGALDPLSGRLVLPMKYTSVRIRPPFIIATKTSGAGREEVETWFAFNLRGQPVPGVGPAGQLDTWDAAGLLVVDRVRAVDVTGSVVVPAGRFDAIRPVGKIAIVRRDGQRGLIDATGAALTPLRYAEMWPLAERDDALIAARVADGEVLRTGVIDTHGKTIVDTTWDRVELKTVKRQEKEVGYFVVSRDNKSGSLDIGGKTIFPPRFDDVTTRDYHDPLHWVADGGLHGLCDLSLGTCPIPVEYQQLYGIHDSYVDEQLCVAQRGNKQGVISDDNATVIPFEYDRFTVSKGTSLRAGDIEARKGFVTTRFRLERGEDQRWRASVMPGSPIGEQPYDLHPLAVKWKPVLDARYLPEGMVTDAEVLAAAQAGRLHDAVFPSIQIADRYAFVNFDQFVRDGNSAAAPMMMVCRDTDGFRLLPAVNPENSGNEACAQNGVEALRFRNDGDAALTCEDCARQGLPVHWRLAGAKPRNACTGKVVDSSITAARRDYADWLLRWKREAPSWLAPEGDKRRLAEGTNSDIEQSVDTGSRAIGTLAVMALEPQRLADPLVDPVSDIPWSHLGLRFMALMEQLEPVGSGGIYPELDDRYALVCAEVWYVRLPALEAAVATGAQVPGIATYELPPTGEFRRRAYPFLTFTRTKNGLRLAGISRELLHAWFWLEFGPGRPAKQ